MRSKGLSLPWIARSGVGASSCRFSGEGGTRLALRTAPAPSLAVVDGTLVSRPGDLDAASRAAIWEAEEREAAEVRPLTPNDVLAGGESGLANLPTLSLQSPLRGHRIQSSGDPEDDDHLPLQQKN
jgi:hypothetical protein